MNSAFITLIASAISMSLLIVLFRYEEARGRRLFEALRIRLDRFVLWATSHLGRVLYWLGAGNVRLFFHAVLHGILHIVLRVIRWSENFVETRLRSNHRKAKAVSQILSENDHFRQLAEHQASTALDEEQKRQLRSFNKK